jgi:four helix bundle protein
MIRRFEDIVSWQKARTLNGEIYRHFAKSKDFGFRDQIQRASVSIMNNIAEGYERGTQKEFKHFLYIAKASCGEVRSMLYLAHDLKYIKEADFRKLSDDCMDISKIIAGFIKTL